MRSWLVGSLALVACTREPPPEMFPIIPGGGGGPGGVTVPDAAADSRDASAEIAGRVCVLSDARNPTTCASSGAAGLAVSLGGATATTTGDGSFTLVRPTGTGLVWHVTGGGIEPTAMQLGTDATIPAIGSLLYGEMLAATSATVVGGDGALIAVLRRGGAAVVSATATATAADSAIYYDGATAVDWTQNSTASFGVVWIPSLVAGSDTLIIDTGTQHMFSGIPIFAGAITFALLEVP